MTEAEQFANAKEFARRILYASWDGSSDVCGGDIQDWAEQLGLIVGREATKEDEESNPDLCEGDTCYEFQDWMRPVKKLVPDVVG